MYAVEMIGITKKFGDFYANKDINLQIKTGEIHCLLGENGAGKTTLMNVLFGLYKPEGGTIKINGEEVVHHSARNAFNLGLGMVHQHFMLVDALTVWENVVVGNELGKFSIPKKESIEAVQKLADQYNFDLDVTQKVSELSVGKKQRVEILKTLYRGANIIILDEPTAGLDPKGASEMINLFYALNRKFNKTVILVTHDNEVVYNFTDEVILMENGKIKAHMKTKELFDNPEILKGLNLVKPQIISLKEALKAKGFKLDGNSNDIKTLVKSLVKELR